MEEQQRCLSAAAERRRCRCVALRRRASCSTACKPCTNLQVARCGRLACSPARCSEGMQVSASGGSGVSCRSFSSCRRGARDVPGQCRSGPEGCQLQGPSLRSPCGQPDKVQRTRHPHLLLWDGHQPQQHKGRSKRHMQKKSSGSTPWWMPPDRQTEKKGSNKGSSSSAPWWRPRRPPGQPAPCRRALPPAAPARRLRCARSARRRGAAPQSRGARCPASTCG